MANIKLGMTLNEVEHTIKNNKYEHAAVLKRGRVIYKVRGTSTGVKLDLPQTKIDSAVITHNHPQKHITDNCLMHQDLYIGMQNNALEIRAVTNSGYIFTIKRPNGGWPDLPTITKELKDVWNHITSHYILFGTFTKPSTQEYFEQLFVGYNLVLKPYKLKVNKFKLRSKK